MALDLQTSVTTRGYGIVKTPECNDILEKIKLSLTVKSNCADFMTVGTKSNDASTKGDDGSFPVYLESKKKLYIPKYYGLKTYGKANVNKISEGDDIHENVVFKGDLRANQLNPVEKYISAAKDETKMGGILQLPPGWGKTVMALHIFSVLRKKTLIIVHKDFLLKQWKERINQYLPSARIGYIKQSVFQTTNVDIVIGSLQTICARDMDKDYGFGLVIVDECHHMGARVFSQALHKMNYRYSLGLSATVNRLDGLSKVFKWFLGDVVFKAKRNKNEQTNVQVIIKEYKCDDPNYSFEYQLYNGRPNISRMLNNICSYLPRTTMLINYLCEHILSEEPERNVLILSDRRQHLVDISSQLKLMGYDESSYGYYVGGMKDNDLLQSEKKQILLGTYNMVSEGFDLPKLNTLVMASPKSNVEQSVGRIQRQLSSEQAFNPLVLDILDTFSLFRNQGKKRKVFYEKQNYAIEEQLVSGIQKDDFRLVGKSFIVNDEE